MRPGERFSSIGGDDLYEKLAMGERLCVVGAMKPEEQRVLDHASGRPRLDEPHARRARPTEAGVVRIGLTAIAREVQELDDGPFAKGKLGDRRDHPDL